MGPLDNSMPVETSKPRNRKKGVLLAGVIVVALIPVVQSTFAANIGINSGTIEFGQGVRSVAACDSDITVTPTSSFDNANNAFTVSQVTITNVNLTDCNAKTFTVKLRNSSGVAVTDGTISFKLDSTQSSAPTGFATASPAPSNLDSTSSAASSTITIVPSPAPAASAVAKITVETN